MKVVLTHGYFLEEDEKEKEIMRPYPTLGLLYVTAFLKHHGIACEVFDSTFQSKTSWKRFMLETRPDVILYYTNLMTKINVIELNDWLKQEHESYISVVGGPDVTYNTQNYLLARFDYCVIGEGEQTALELIQALKESNPVSEIHGLAFLNLKSELVTTEARTKLKSLDELPWPDRSAIPLEKYLDVWQKHHGKRTANISTQRGCPYTCKWCSTAVYGQSYRRRPAKDVVDEIEMLRDKYDVEALWFVDDVFTVSHKWIDAFHDEMRSRGVNVSFEIITRAERLNKGILEKLKSIGCFRIWIGAESGSQKIIDKMDRRVDIKEVSAMIKLTQQCGMEAGTFIMVGYPDETQEDIYQTARYLEESIPDQFTITLAYPIKGTSLYSEIEDRIIAQPNWQTSTDRDIDFTRTYNSGYYKHAIRFLNNRYQAAKTLKSGNRLKSKMHSTKAQIAEKMMQTTSRGTPEH